ncbi:hypothetical protein OG512_46650 [Streptomyces sp. NBC_01378]|uniref:hypothetical protein n=1 Tax=Streptomyces sp. NBC_01378 TaxID=2903844 RepID=UPI00324E88CD
MLALELAAVLAAALVSRPHPERELDRRQIIRCDVPLRRLQHVRVSLGIKASVRILTGLATGSAAGGTDADMALFDLRDTLSDVRNRSSKELDAGGAATGMFRLAALDRLRRTLQ